MRKTKIILAIVPLLMAALVARSQDTVVRMSDDLRLANVPKAERPIHPLTDLDKLKDTLQTWEFHLSMGSSFLTGNRGSASLFGITPSVIYRPNDRLTIKATASAFNSYTLSPGGYSLHGRSPRNLAPLRNPGPAAAGTLGVSASWKVNDRLWIAASLMHAGGQLSSAALVNPWLLHDGHVDLDATAFSAALRYKIGDDNFLDLYMTVIDDRTGAMLPLMMGAPFSGSLSDPFGIHHGFYGTFSDY